MGSAHVTFIKLLVAVTLLPAFLPGPSAAAQEVDDNFVIASLLISEPGGALYSRLGHAALHMQCPEHNLDYVFSYNSEDIYQKPLTFLSGRLKMGLMAVSPEEYLKDYSEQGRGVREYTLNLPIEAKRNLWRVLDGHLMEGVDLEFDYIRRGCAYGSLMLLKEGLGEKKIKYGQWPEYFEGASRREITYEHIKDYKWSTFLLHFLCNGIIDRIDCTNEQKVIIPADLPEVLSKATVDGVPVIDDAGKELLPDTWEAEKGWFSPMHVAFMLLVLTIICAFLRTSVMNYVLLGIQTLLGIAAVWLLLSPLCCTEWSWLLVPFNPLPLIFWKWRRYWALPYAIVLLIWAAFMFLWPHLLTDGAYIIISLSLFFLYTNTYYKFHKHNYE